MTPEAQKAFDALELWGLLMHADGKLPSVTTLVAGEPVKGSWWGHPRGRAIYAVMEEIDGSDVATSARLVDGKLAFVHRSLWSVLHRVGTCAEHWQTKGLSKMARDLELLVGQRGTVRTDELSAKHRTHRERKKDAARELEDRLLVHTQQVHTDTGRHARVLSAWDFWARNVGLDPADADVDSARARLDDVVERWNAEFGARAKLPW